MLATTGPDMGVALAEVKVLPAAGKNALTDKFTMEESS